MVVGYEQTLTLVATNTGNGTIRLSTPILEGLRSSTFEVEIVNRDIAAGESTPIHVTFDPSRSGSIEVTLTLRDRRSILLATVTLKAQAVQPVPSFSENRIDFGDVAVGESAARRVTVSNTGDGLLVVVAEEGEIGPFSVEPAKLLIAPGASAEVNILFAPMEEGDFEESLRFAHNGHGRREWLRTSGTAIARELVVDETPNATDSNDVAEGLQDTLDNIPGPPPSRPDPSFWFDFDSADGNQGDTETHAVFPGDTFVVQMFGQDLSPFTGYQVLALFDDTRIRFAGHRPTPLFGESATKHVDLEGGRIWVSLDSESDAEPGAETFLYEMAFTMIEQTDTSPVEVTVKYIAVDFSDGSVYRDAEERHLLPAKVIPRRVVSTADFNEDGIINWFDLNLFVSGYNTSNDEFDLNENGVVDFADFLELVAEYSN